MVYMTVEKTQRYAKMRAHTATHLLHAQLVTIFPQTKQAWSLVDDDYVRFDFVADRALTDQEIVTIQDTIQRQIQQSLPVTIQEMSFDDAQKRWAKAFFEDKYGDTVRVVSIGTDLSVELCGGTHVVETGQIGAFLITKQESVSSGTRRIHAYVWPKVAFYAQEQKEFLTDIASQLGVKEAHIMARLDNMIAEQKQLQADYQSLRDTTVVQYIQGLPFDGWEIDCIVDKEQHTLLADMWFKDLVAVLKQRQTDKTMLVREQSWAFVIVSWSDRAKEIAQAHGLRGGGSTRLVQGKDPSVMEIGK